MLLPKKNIEAKKDLKKLQPFLSGHLQGKRLEDNATNDGKNLAKHPRNRQRIRFVQRHRNFAASYTSHTPQIAVDCWSLECARGN